MVWFDNPLGGDWIKEIGIFSGATRVGGFIDDDMAVAEQGWFFHTSGALFIKGISGGDFLQSGLKLKFIAEKGDLSSDTLRANIRWGKR